MTAIVYSLTSLAVTHTKARRLARSPRAVCHGYQLLVQMGKITLIDGATAL